MQVSTCDPETGTERRFTRCIGGWREMVVTRRDGEEWARQRFHFSADAQSVADEV